MTTIYDFPPPSPDAQARSDHLLAIMREELMKGGHYSFAHFMQEALYHPTLGYYNAPEFTLGKMGDFTTAPEISPLFAYCFAEQCLALFPVIGENSVLELGAGSGRFAKDFLTHLAKANSLPSRYYIYEISESLRIKQRHFLETHCPQWLDRVVWLTDLPAHFEGIILANEVLDAIPTHCFQIGEKQSLERTISLTEQNLSWSLNELSEINTEIDKLKEQWQLPNGYQSEINFNAADYVKRLAQHLKKGVMLFADYGYGQREYYHPQRRQGTLTCFYQHHKHNNPLILPGLQDITAHVDFTRIIESAADEHCSLLGFTTQSAFLLGCNLMSLAENMSQSLSPTESFTLNQAIKVLTLPTEMGDLIKMMAISKACDAKLQGFSLLDRRRDLS